MAYGSPMLPRLSSNAQKASGASVLMINRTSFSLILGNFISPYKATVLHLSLKGYFGLRYSVYQPYVHGLLTSTLSVQSSGSMIRLISCTALGLPSLS